MTHIKNLWDMIASPDLDEEVRVNLAFSLSTHFFSRKPTLEPYIDMTREDLVKELGKKAADNSAHIDWLRSYAQREAILKRIRVELNNRFFGRQTYLALLQAVIVGYPTMLGTNDKKEPYNANIETLLHLGIELVTTVDLEFATAGHMLLNDLNHLSNNDYDILEAVLITLRRNIGTCTLPVGEEFKTTHARRNLGKTPF